MLLTFIAPQIRLEKCNKVYIILNILNKIID